MPTDDREAEVYEAPQLRGVPCCVRCFAALASGPYQDEWAGLVPVGGRLPGGGLLCKTCAEKQVAEEAKRDAD